MSQPETPAYKAYADKHFATKKAVEVGVRAALAAIMDHLGKVHVAKLNEHSDEIRALREKVGELEEKLAGIKSRASA
jgi:hypothetical protein